MNVYAPRFDRLPNRLSTASGVGLGRGEMPVAGTLRGDAAAKLGRVAWPARSLAAHIRLFEEIDTLAGRTLAENTLHLLANNAANSARQPWLASFAGNLAERAKNRSMCRTAARSGANSVYADAFNARRNRAAAVGGAKEMNCHAGF